MSQTKHFEEVPPYYKLASYYDKVMSYIDYEVWIHYLHDLCGSHAIKTENVLDLSCGSGKTIPYMRNWLSKLYCMDLSINMIRKLHEEFPEMRQRSWVADMRHLPLKGKFDLIMNIQDSINYFMNSEQITDHLSEVYHYVTRTGAYIFDFSTENNIKNNFIDMHEIYEDEDYGYERINNYLPHKKMNITEFYIWELEGTERKNYYEKHVQQMYSQSEVEACLQNSLFKSWYFYEDETLESPTDEAERIHVLALKGRL